MQNQSFIGKTPSEINGVVTRIAPPVGGWKAKTYYAVDVAFSKTNPIHRVVFYTGYLTEDGRPNGYNRFFTFGTDRLEYIDAYFLHAVRELEVKA